MGERTPRHELEGSLAELRKFTRREGWPRCLSADEVAANIEVLEKIAAFTDTVAGPLWIEASLECKDTSARIRQLLLENTVEELDNTKRSELLSRVNGVWIWSLAIGPSSSFDSKIEEIKLSTEQKIAEAKREIQAVAESTKTQIQEATQSAKDQIAKSTKTQIQKATQSAKDQMLRTAHEQEHRALTHVMTLMGVFSAIITIVMSLVSTSASWLNNANGASAMLAFLVPTAVGVFSVSALLLIVYGYNTISVSSTEGYQKKRGRYIGFFAAPVVVMVVFGVLLGIAVSHHTSEESQVLHLRYALSPGQYDTVEQDGTYCYSFEIEGKPYVFECNDTYPHDGILYYCSEHNKLE